MADVISAPYQTGISPAGSANYLNDPKGVMSWLGTIDHKRIGIMYLISVMVFFLAGGLFALLLRLSLFDPSHVVFGHKLLDAETYNRVFTLHGVIMVFLFIIPSIPAALGNFVLPLMLGGRARPWRCRGLSLAGSTPAGRFIRRIAPRRTQRFLSWRWAFSWLVSPRFSRD